MVPFEAGRRIAAGLPGPHCVPLQARNHLCRETAPAFGQFLEPTRSFLAREGGHWTAALACVAPLRPARPLGGGSTDPPRGHDGT